MILPTAALAAQYSGTFEYFETSRIDARSNQPLPVAPTPPPREVAIAADASFAPVARLRSTDRRWDYTLSYSPTFTVTDVELTTSPQPVVLNAGTASVGWHDRRLRIVVSEAASFGWENLAYLYATPVAGQPLAAGQSQATGQTAGQTVGQAPGQTSGQTPGQTGTAPTVPLRVFPFGSSNTSASLALRATRLVTLLLSGGYSLSGNLTNNLQAARAYPEQFGPSASASMAYTSSRVDSFVATASAQEITTPLGVCATSTVGQILPVGKTCRQVAPLLQLEETARHSLSSTATVSAGLGVSAAIYQLSTGNAWGILPIGGVAFTDRLRGFSREAGEQASGVRLAADLVPTVNIFTGEPSNRIEFEASLVTPVASHVVVNFVAGALQTIPMPHPDPSPLTVLSCGVDMRVRLTHFISVDFGVQSFWQAQQNEGVLPAATTAATTGPTTSASEVGYVSLTVHTPTLRF